MRTAMSTVDGADELQRDWFRQVSQGYAKIALRRAAEPAELTGSGLARVG